MDEDLLGLFESANRLLTRAFSLGRRTEASADGHIWAFMLFVRIR